VDCFEKISLTTAPTFFDTDKRHIRVFQKKGEWKGRRVRRKHSRAMGGKGNTDSENYVDDLEKNVLLDYLGRRLLHSFAK